MSGVVFAVKESSSHRDVGRRRLYFCCESCATYFASHTETVLAARHLSPTA